jgi:acetyl esterase/lipase
MSRSRRSRVRVIVRAAGAALGMASAGMGLLHRFRVRTTKESALSAPKLMAGALSPYAAMAGATGALLGLVTGSPLVVAAGLWGAKRSWDYVSRVYATGGDYARVFGPDRSACLELRRNTYTLARRWTWCPPQPPEPIWERDVVFWTLPATETVPERPLRCDIWQPPEGVSRSGLAVIYFHGSGWHFLDKDTGTRPMFRYLTSQGHVVMDVAYRLCPEVGWQEMAGDPRRAVTWLKARAADYGADPERIVLAGGSAGGHLALLTAYAPVHPDLTPDDVVGADLSVCGVVSWYGPTDMRVYYKHAAIPFNMPVEAQGASSEVSDRIIELLGFDMKLPECWEPGQTIQEAMMHGLLGGTPEEAHDAYRLFSPVEYVGPHCPPTLLLQGEYDMITSAEAVREMARKLDAAGVPVVHVEYPQTEHAFDIILPRISPSAQAALYELDRFLGVLV